MPSTCTVPAGSTQELTEKLRRVIGALQVTALAYLVWVLWEITRPLRDPSPILAWLGRVAQGPLPEVQPWQWGAYLAVDLLTWTVMAWAVKKCWQAMAQIKQMNGGDQQAARHLVQGAWLAVTTEVLSILARPLKTYLLTCGAEGPQAVVHWFFHPQDLLVTLLCLSLLGLAYVFSWKTLLAEENKGFI
jgi:hypothetical protein